MRPIVATYATALAVATAGAQTGVPANPSGASNVGNQVLIGAFLNQQSPRCLMQRELQCKRLR
jgi:hypothetical protein